MIEVNDLVKRYGDHIAVDHLSFQLEPGRIYGFLGPNGAGKSTTMNIMTGYLGATEGTVVIDGHDILEEPEEAKKRIGYLPEIPPLYTDMMVWEYLDFAAELKGISKKDREAKLDGIMQMTRINDVANRMIRNLSKGYRQRVGIAQALIGDPKIIILDEPTVGLDPKQIIEIRQMIRELAKDRTIILSSHILAEVQEVCDYILIISKGRLVAADTPENLEKMWDGEVSIHIEAPGNKESVSTIIHRVADAGNIRIVNEEDGLVEAEILPEHGKDIRKEIFFAFAKANTPLLTMGISKASLEDVFIELTESEKEDLEAENEQEEE